MQTAAGRFTVSGKPASLKVAVDEAAVQARIAPGVVVAAGPPGNVYKGPTEQRGTVLTLALPAATAATLTTRLRF
ncbi:MAG: hypothetical protein QFF03_09995 [Pseudomonadota bacterium]|nr:hypothetical protein [Pseudomonadota bacterium]